jgi:hypothetical protein
MATYILQFWQEPHWIDNALGEDLETLKKVYNSQKQSLQLNNESLTLRIIQRRDIIVWDDKIHLLESDDKNEGW